MKGTKYVKIKGNYIVEYVMKSNIDSDIMERVKKANELFGLDNE
jgi:hypothetical protein